MLIANIKKPKHSASVFFILWLVLHGTIHFALRIFCFEIFALVEHLFPLGKGNVYLAVAAIVYEELERNYGQPLLLQFLLEE